MIDARAIMVGHDCRFGLCQDTGHLNSSEKSMTMHCSVFFTHYHEPETIETGLWLKNKVNDDALPVDIGQGHVQGQFGEQEMWFDKAKGHLINGKDAKSFGKFCVGTCSEKL